MYVRGKIMGFWDKLRGELIDIIEWTDASQDTMVCRFERAGNEIKYGAKLIVRESQTAVFVNEGKLADVFTPGTYTLETKNMPILTTLNSWMHGFNSPFKAEVYFVSMKLFTNCKWGTKNPIMLRDPEFGPVRLRAFGTYEFRVKDPSGVIRAVSGTNAQFSTEQISEQLKNYIITRFTDLIGESRIPVLDLASNYNELSDFIKNKIQPDIEKYGFEFTTFLVENISLPPEVEAALDKRTSMGIIGNLNAYTQFQAANALENSSKQSGIGSESLVMGMGFSVANQMAQSMSQQTRTPPPLPLDNSFFVSLNGQQSGPFGMPELQNLVQQGRITEQTLVWKNGMPQWIPAVQSEELKRFFQQTPPPIPGGPPPLPNAQPEISCYVNLNGQQSGPFNNNQLRNLIIEGKLNRDTLVWKNGMPDWKPAEQIQDISGLFD